MPKPPEWPWNVPWPPPGYVESAEGVQDTGTQLQFSPYQMNDKGNVVALGPVSREYSEIEALLIVVAFVKFMKTSEGQKHVKDIVVAYLNSMSKAISAMQDASCSHVYTALMNQAACTNIYARIGLITPFDQVRTLLWLDHYFGELLKKDYVLQGVTTLVKSGMESAGQLATLAKVFTE